MFSLKRRVVFPTWNSNAARNMGKRCGNNIKDEDNSLKTLNDKN